MRVQKTNLGVEDYTVFLKVLLLVRSAAHIKTELSFNPGNKINVNDAIKMSSKFTRYIDDRAQELIKEVPNISDKAIRLALKSNIKNDLTDIDEGSARLLYVLNARYHNYQPDQKVDRGAESPDKSWYAVAKKNAAHYGFNKRILEELYRIAADNNW